ncbi:hypothetical protein DNX69_06700 [Rhodopseudomonas palustris]|uniref:DUF2946 domain-containing protein n=1 Tax=Rhodopseudomonas palustris TaxID=1076 RepID=A0A323UNW6_RHOPL|nr:hypothetical protein [Rhodopseudomonas palustris]PZA12766.1 hypothetical protein DNX69_06700 [Rhodopseudomonas palustris]
MTPSARIFQHRLLRISRRVVAAFVLAVYLLAGALHGVHDLDVTSGSATAIVTLASSGGNHSDQAIVGEHHCHGCFSVSLPNPSVVATTAQRASAPLRHQDAERRSILRVIDPPPPKALI